LQITDFTRDHIEPALDLVKANYEKERECVPSLPPMETFPKLDFFADNGLGVAAFENDVLVGFLGCYGPIDNSFGTTGVKGNYVPVNGYGAVSENRERRYRRLYQAAAEKWVGSGIVSHVVSLYAHDTVAVDTFFMNGFGLRTVEAVRQMEEIDCSAVPGYLYRELGADRKAETLPLKNLLIDHLGSSPMFMPYPQMTESILETQYQRRHPRYFTAHYEDRAVAWIEVIDGGENFVGFHESMKNICGASCLPEHRGKGVMQNLLNLTITTLKSEGFTRLGVDFESFNPNASGFWPKYFTPYIYGVVRRIDEYILNTNTARSEP